MTRYLALAKAKKEVIGFCFYDDIMGNYEIFSALPGEIEIKIIHYKPDYLLYSSSEGLRANYKMMEIKHNFPSLEIIHVGGIGSLADGIIVGIRSIPGLERKPGRGGTIYSEYYFGGRKIFGKALRKALFVMYLYKPWSEVSEVKIINNVGSKKNVPVLDYYQLLKNINMTDFNSEVKELINKLTEMSKLSYLGSLSSKEIKVLIDATENFGGVLRQVYPLKKQEEGEEQGDNKVWETKKEKSASSGLDPNCPASWGEKHSADHECFQKNETEENDKNN